MRGYRACPSRSPTGAGKGKHLPGNAPRKSTNTPRTKQAHRDINNFSYALSLAPHRQRGHAQCPRSKRADRQWALATGLVRTHAWVGEDTLAQAELWRTWTAPKQRQPCK